MTRQSFARAAERAMPKSTTRPRWPFARVALIVLTLACAISLATNGNGAGTPVHATSPAAPSVTSNQLAATTPQSPEWRSGSSQPPVPANQTVEMVVDPVAPGPYAVGVTTRTFTRPASGNGGVRRLETVIWYPAASQGQALDPRLAGVADAPPDPSGAPYPVVMFSHGSGGVPWQSTFLTAHLASHGFVVAAPPHPGNTVADCPGGCLDPSPESRARLVESALNRPADIVAAFEQLAALGTGADPVFAGLVDPARAGVTGHSFGAYTALMVAARDGRFRAVVAMAPPVLPVLRAAVADLTVPTMLMAGGRDHLTPLTSVQSLYDSLPDPGPERWLVEFPRGGHMAYTNVCRAPRGCGPDDLPPATAHTLIRRWAVAFLLHHVALDPRAAALLDPALASGNPDLAIQFVPGR